MRPSDENQATSNPKLHPHLRPNLMSAAHRGGHEDSILAKLEREPARRAGHGNGLRLAWYGSAAVLAMVLTATLAWLAADAGSRALEADRIRHDGPAIVSGPPPLPVPEPSASTPARIVDSTHEPAPPLRMLDTPATKAEPAEAPVIAVAPPQPAPMPEVGAEVHPEVRPELGTGASPSPGTSARNEPRPATGAKPRIAARAPSRQPSRPQRNAAPARQGAQDDGDVALISAIIYHANGHADAEGNDEKPSPCADESCRTRPARQ